MFRAGKRSCSKEYDQREREWASAEEKEEKCYTLGEIKEGEGKAEKIRINVDRN